MLLALRLAIGVVGASHAVPHAPSITSVSAGVGSLTIVWTAPSDTGSSAITAYDVRTIETAATDKADANWTEVDDAWTSGDLTHTVTGLTGGGEYDVQVRAVNTSGDGDGDWSATSTGTPQVGAPSISSVVAGDAALTVAWTAPSNSDAASIGAYDLRYIASAATDKADANWTEVDDAWTTGDLTHTVTGLTNGTGYDVQVRAVAGSPGPWSATSTGTPADHGDTRASATVVALGTRVDGVIEPGTDVDYFKLVLSERTDVLIATSGDLEIAGEFQNSGGSAIDTISNGYIEYALGQIFVWGTLGSGTYFVKIGSNAELTGAYALQTRTVADTTGRADAQPIALDSFGNGILVEDDIDYFKISLQETTDLIIRTSGLYADTEGRLYDEDGRSIANDHGGQLPPDRDHFLIRTRLDAGVYFVSVEPFGFDGSVAYTLYVDTVTEPGNTTATATPLAFDDAQGGRIDPGSDVDYFRLDVAEARYVSLGVVGENVRISGELLDSNGTAVDTNIYVTNHSNPQRRVVYLSDRLDAGTYFLKVSSSEDSAGLYTVLASEDPAYRYLYNRCSRIATSYDDPLYGCQWHLKNTGQLGGTSGEDINVEGAWATVMGTGITVAVVDGGMDVTHEDLTENLDTSKNHDYHGARSLFDFGRSHGTSVAGVIAARDNSLGVRGVAPRATIYSYSFGSSLSDDQAADAMTRHMATTAVSSNSWGNGEGLGLKPAPASWEMAVDSGVTTGYDGKGVVYIFAAGNGASFGDNANYDEYTSYYGVTAVCSVNDRGRQSRYSEDGANLWGLRTLGRPHWRPREDHHHGRCQSL